MALALVHSPPLRKAPFRHRVEYALFRLFVIAFRLLPERLGYLFFEMCFLIVGRLLPRLGRRSLEHIEIAFGDELSDTAKRRLAEESLRYTAWFWADMLNAPHLLKRDAYRQRVDCSELMDAIQSNGDLRENGFLVVSGHLGSPDIIPLALGYHGYENSVVARRMDNPHIDAYVKRARAPFKREVFHKVGAIRPAYRYLKNNGFVGIQVDQDAGVEGVFAPFFGHLASTHRGPAVLGLMTQCPTYMVYCVRTSRRAFDYKVIVDERIDVSGEASDPAAILRITKAMTRSVERAARCYPEQYLWAHRRWKTRPPSEIVS